MDQTSSSVVSARCTEGRETMAAKSNPRTATAHPSFSPDGRTRTVLLQRFDRVPAGELEVTVRVMERAELSTIADLNRRIFEEERIINTFDRHALMMLLAEAEGQPIGFKIGYARSGGLYYSAKGGVLPAYRRYGVARLLLQEMTERAAGAGYERFAFDTFPNRHPGMTGLGLSEGFEVVKADFNATYQDYRLRFEKSLS